MKQNKALSSQEDLLPIEDQLLEHVTGGNGNDPVVNHSHVGSGYMPPTYAPAYDKLKSIGTVPQPVIDAIDKGHKSVTFGKNNTDEGEVIIHHRA